MVDHHWITAAAARRRVRLVTGETATLLSWGVRNDKSRARVEFPNGRQRTVSKATIDRLLEPEGADIVDRLRASAPYGLADYTLLVDAAAEIEALRTETLRLHGHILRSELADIRRREAENGAHQ